MAKPDNNMPQQYIDKQLVARCFAHSRNTYEQEASVQRQVAEKMMQRLEAVWRALPRCSWPQRIVEVGCGTGSFSRLLQAELRPQSLLLNDLCPEMNECLNDLCSLPGVSFKAEDAELLTLPTNTQLIASCSTVQWFNHLKEFFQKCHEALEEDGWLAFSSFGPQNMTEIRSLTGNGLMYLTLTELKSLLEPFFDIGHAEEEIATLSFASPMDVLKHMKQTGVTGTEKRVWSRGRLLKFCEEYQQLFSEPNGQVRLTYHPIYIIAKKKKP